MLVAIIIRPCAVFAPVKGIVLRVSDRTVIAVEVKKFLGRRDGVDERTHLLKDRDFII